MEVPDDIPFKSLEDCSYRYLQQLAKSMSLPSNVKKVYLIEMIYAKKFRSAEQLDSIVARIKEERKQTAKPRKTTTRKKKRVQGTEISSTSNHSPSICSTPTREYYPSSRSKKHTNSTLNPLIAKRTVESDRVLRSYNNRVRTKYSLVEINDCGIIEAQKTLSNKEKKGQYEWNRLQRYRPVKVGDCMVQRQLSDKTEYVPPRPRPIYVDVNESRASGSHSHLRGPVFDSGDRQLVPIANSLKASAVRECRLSDIYPLELKSHNRLITALNYHHQDGRVSKINAVQKPMNPEYTLKNKMTQTVQKRLAPKPIIVSLRNAIRPQLTSVQDVVNYKIDSNFSNSSTESARGSSTERDMPRMITSFQESFEKSTYRGKRDTLYNRDYSIENAKRHAEGNRSVEISSRYTLINQPRRIDNKMCVTEHQTRRTDNKMYVTKNQVKRTDNKIYVREDQRRAKNIMNVTDNQRRTEDNGMYAERTKRLDNKMYSELNQRYTNNESATDNQTKRIDNKMYAALNQRRNNKKYAIVNQPERKDNKIYPTKNVTMATDNMYGTDNETRQTDNITQNQGRHTNKMYTIENESRSTDNKMYVTENKMSCTDKKTTTENQTKNKEIRSYSTENQNGADNRDRQVLKTYSKKYRNSETSNKINSDYVIHIQNQSDKHATLSSNNDVEGMDYIDNQSENADMDKNCLVIVNTGRNETDYPNMSALTDVYPENQEVISEASNEPNSPTVYYHKKIRAEHVRTQRLSLSVERRPAACLPHISEVFSHLAEPRYHSLTEPLYVHCGDDADKVISNGGSLQSFNYNVSDLLQPLTDHKLVTSAACAFSSQAPPVARTASTGHTENKNSSQEVDQQCGVGSRSMPRLDDYLGIAEQECDVACDEVLQYTSESSVTSMPSDLGADVTLPSGADTIEDALELISQDGDYMERINMDVRMQCILCDWAGPRSILEYHVGYEHASEIISRSSPSWCTMIPLDVARHGTREISECAGLHYVLSVSCVANRFLADITKLPKDDELEYCSKYGRLTVYNKMTGEPHVWEGLVIDLPESTDGFGINGLNVDLSNLDLLPNSANLKLVNGEWVVNSSAKVVVGQLDLNDIEIVVHVQIYD